MKVIYKVTLRSKERNIRGPDTPRDFGGVIPGRMEYTVETVSIPAKIDSTARRKARKIAQEKKSIILKVTKTWTNARVD